MIMTNRALNSTTQIRSRVMRRVYYAFVLSFIFRPAFWQGAVLGVGLALLGQLTHVAAWSQNLLAVPVGQLPSHVWTVFMATLADGEFLKLLAIGFIIYALLSFKLPRRRYSSRNWQAV